MQISSRYAAMIALILISSIQSAHGQPGSEPEPEPEPEIVYPSRVNVWILLVLPFAWGFLMLLIVGLYHFGLRAGKRKSFAELKQKGQIESTGDDGEGATDDVSKSWFTASLDKVRTENGLDAALYLQHNEHMALFCLVQFVVIGLPLCLVYSQAGDYESDSLTMYAWSYANFKPENSLKWIPVTISYVVIFTTIGLLIYKQKVMDKWKLADKEDETAATTTVWVRGLPRDSKEEVLQNMLEKQYNDAFVEARLVWDVNLLGHNIRARRRLITKSNEISLKLNAPGVSPEKAAKLQDKINAQKQTVAELESQEPELRKKKLSCAGSAFVTFTSIDMCREFRADVNARKLQGGSDLAVQSWSTEMAPKPFEIYWENFGLESGQKLANFIKSYGLTVSIFLFFVAWTCIVVWLIGYLYMELLYKCPPKESIDDVLTPMRDAITPYVWYGLLTPIALGLFLFMEEEMAPIIKFISKYELPLTKSLKQSSFMGKAYFFYVIYHLFLSTAAFALLCATVQVAAEVAGGSMKLYVESIGMFHQNRCFLTACIIDMAHVLEGTAFFTRPGHTLTKEEEEKFGGAEDEEDDEEKIADHADDFFNDKFNFSRNYAETLGVFTSICYYQVMHPTILLCGSFYYIVKFYVVRPFHLSHACRLTK
eukprot:SAG31_NODE_122_length_23797_cov_39.343812_3_plen_653_part_00